MLSINEDNSAFMAQHKRDISAATRRATATANYHSANSSSVSSSSPTTLPLCISVDDLISNVESRSRRGKRDVEIISGRDRRLQGEGEETGARLQRDRSGVSEMEPLPATQDALRLELRPADAWNYAIRPPSLPPVLFVETRPRTTVDPRAYLLVVIVATFVVVDDVVIVVIVFTRVFGLLVSSLAGYPNPPPADFMPIRTVEILPGTTSSCPVVAGSRR